MNVHFFLIQGTAKRKGLFNGYWKMVYLTSYFVNSFFWKEAKFTWIYRQCHLLSFGCFFGTALGRHFNCFSLGAGSIVSGMPIGEVATDQSELSTLNSIMIALCPWLKSASLADFLLGRRLLRPLLLPFSHSTRLAT